MFAAPPSPLSVDDSNPNIEPEKLKELEEHIKSYLKKVSEAQKNTLEKLIRILRQTSFSAAYGAM